MPKNYINHIGTYNDHSKSITINGANTNVADLIRTFMQDEPTKEKPEPEDVSPIDTSFFTSHPFSPEMIEKNLRQAISLASSKADACRRLMALETQGYIILSNLTDEQKAEVINPFAAPS